MLGFKPRKYRNHKTADGFDSKREKAVFLKLEAMRSAQIIEDRVTDIQRQVRFELIPVQRIAGKVVERACHYVADFLVTFADGHTEVWDAKGFKTPDYVIKRKLMLHVHGIQIKEV